jgi:ubiquinone biosynthesis protein COQ9
MSLAGNIPASVSELAKLSDEMWFLAGDDSHDMNWYTKRATLSGVYASTGENEDYLVLPNVLPVF